MKRILFPADFSDQMRAVAPAVKAMAERFGAEVTLLNVMPPYWEHAGSFIPMGEMAPVASIPDNLEGLRSSLAARLAGALVTELSGVPVKRVVEIGDPAATITQYAKSEGVDLIMLPTRGYGPFRSLLLGSVAAKVLHDAECPVWTAAHAEQSDAHHAKTGVGCERVLCALDAAPNSERVMKWAVDYTSRCGAQLEFVHAVRSPGSWIERQMDREFEQALAEQGRKQLEEQMKAVGVEAPLHVGAGDVENVVRDRALQTNADLAIIGRGVLDKTFGRLRTHAYAIIRSAPCPVLSV